MLTLYIRNITHCKPVSDYEYIVMVNAEKIAEGTVTGHKRADGWQKLIRLIADNKAAKG